jgi:hypothetical protein
VNEFAGLAIVGLFAVLILGFAAVSRWRNFRPAFREIRAFAVLPESLGHAVESGKGLHLSLGSGGLGGPESAAALVGLAMLSRMIEMTGISDQPPIVTSGNGITTILAQDTLRTIYARQNAEARYEPTAAKMAGPTPMSYAAGAMPFAADETVHVNVLVGSFGESGALIAHAGAAGRRIVLAGSDRPETQALFYAVSDSPLIGEELYAGGAYLNAGPLHGSSLQAQDALRLVIAAALLAGAALTALGRL